MLVNLQQQVGHHVAVAVALKLHALMAWRH